MSEQSFHFSFSSSKNSLDLFHFLAEPRNWWMGVYGEVIDGNSSQPGDEFSFSAADGVHHSRQKLVESVPGKRISWLVTGSNLSFLNNTNEWTGTTISFTLEQQGDRTSVTFLHEGLVPAFECYEACSGGWTQYLQKLAAQMK